MQTHANIGHYGLTILAYTGYLVLDTYTPLSGCTSTGEIYSATGSLQLDSDVFTFSLLISSLYSMLFKSQF